MTTNVISPDDLVCGLLNNTPTNGSIDSLGTIDSPGTIDGILPVYKEWGETPLQTLDRLRVAFPVLAKTTLSYAGRLDPLAEGLMLILVGSANKERESYLGLHKVYEVEVLLGVSTDTGDIFGVPKMEDIDDEHADTNSEVTASGDIDTEDLKINECLESFVGKQSFAYPLYSSKTVQGKPLHQWVMEGRVSEIEIPKKEIEISSIKNLGVYEVLYEDVLDKVRRAVQTVKGDFRYEEIEKSWYKKISKVKSPESSELQKTLELSENPNPNSKFKILKIECSCSSGTYMRTLAEEIGKVLGISSLAYSIKRTRVGDFTLNHIKTER